ncbi:protein FAM174C-like [Coregonus clupeaformis]|uniref:protein FAM174C-like n=1 Tax=Coregonus clupeaformis TaxID=59861 RepID=UPI001E1C9DAF|nr:protein FAM174C-like [Coregonus clupeaformis]
MQFQGVMSIVLPTLWAISTIAEETLMSPTGITTTAAAITTKHVTNSSVNNTTSKNNHIKFFNVDNSMIQRTLYVLIGITTIGVLYFLVRVVRLKKTTTSRKKYGLLSNYDDSVEMAALESDEEDDTVYEARSLRR